MIDFAGVSSQLFTGMRDSQGTADLTEAAAIDINSKMFLNIFRRFCVDVFLTFLLVVAPFFC